jgi:hypothetical protein
MSFNLASKYFSFILIILFFISFYFSLDNSILFFYNVVIFVNIYIIILYRRNPAILLLFIFCLFYTLSLIPYYFYNINISAWNDFNEIKYYNHVLRIYGCFIVTPLFFYHKKFLNFNETFKSPTNPNQIGFYIFSFICLLVIIFGQSGNNIFIAGGYASDESTKSVIYEYFILFLLIAYYYSNKKKIQLIIILFLFVFYIFKSLLFGGRIEVIQLIILGFYVLILDFNMKLSSLKLIIGCLMFYYFNQVVGAIRSNPLPLLEGNYIAYLNPFDSILNPKLNYISSNEGDVFQSSARLIGLIDNGILDFYMRIKSFFFFFLSIIIPKSWLPEEASLITYKKDIYNSGGGGFITVYFFAFLGWLGPFVISAYLFWIYKLLNIFKSDYLKLYGLMLFSTFPRWFAYNPIILFKLCLFIIPIAFMSNMILASIRLKLNKH